MKHANSSRRSAANRTHRARYCPKCHKTDALRFTEDRETRTSVTTCRFGCGFTETRGRGAV